jgi:hypothetical protein
MKFLQIQGHHYIFTGLHTNGNHYWVFGSNEKLNNDLENWKKYKSVFSEN